MIDPSLVKANVVDLRTPGMSLPKSVVTDTKILYLVYYDPAALVLAGGKPPAPYQLSAYPRWWKRAVFQKVTLCTATVCLAELAQVVERTELEIIWRTDPARPELDPRQPGQDYSLRYAKTVRYLYASRLAVLRADVETDPPDCA